MYALSIHLAAYIVGVDIVVFRVQPLQVLLPQSHLVKITVVLWILRVMPIVGMPVRRSLLRHLQRSVPSLLVIILHVALKPPVGFSVGEVIPQLFLMSQQEPLQKLIVVLIMLVP